MDHGVNQIAMGVGEDVALAALVSQKMLIQQLRQLESDGVFTASRTRRCRRKWNTV
jgi:DNA-binding HxlR family transcriptional regulator